jgi:hypothetical protein
MSKQFYFTFGNGDGATFTGLSPTLSLFLWNGLTALPAPAITELTAGTGIYGFQYGTTASIIFKVDGGATLSVGQFSGYRFFYGNIDPVLAVDQAIGYATDSFGSTATDPTTLYGQAKRNQEFNEGAKVFTKSTGIWDIYSRGSSALLLEKTLSNTTTSATSSP